MRVLHDLDHSFISEKVLKLAPCMAKNNVFFNENWSGSYSINFRFDDVCKMKKAPGPKLNESQKENRVQARANLANPNYSQVSY